MQTTLNESIQQPMNTINRLLMVLYKSIFVKTIEMKS